MNFDHMLQKAWFFFCHLLQYFSFERFMGQAVLTGHKLLHVEMNRLQHNQSLGIGGGTSAFSLSNMETAIGYSKTISSFQLLGSVNGSEVLQQHLDRANRGILRDHPIRT